MEMKDVIKARRSVRKFKSDPVSKEIILELLEAAGLAPSATNRQPWEFVLVHRSYLDGLDQVLREVYSGVSSSFISIIYSSNRSRTCHPPVGR